MVEVELESVRDVSPTRFREKASRKGEIGSRRHIANQAILLVNDAIHLQTSEYYIDEIDGKVKTVWQGGDYAREVALWMRGTTMTTLMSFLSTLDLFLSLIHI